MRLRFWHWLILLLALVALSSSLLFVDQAEYVFVTRFGSPVALYDGAADAGLHWKLPWPVETAVRFDRRLDLVEVPTQELLIRDRDEASGTEKPLPLTFDLFVTWRIGGPEGTSQAAAVDRFVRGLGSIERARAFLQTQVVSRLKMELGEISFAELVNTDAKKLRMQEVLRRVREHGSAEAPSLNARAADLGLLLLDVGCRRFNHPAQVRPEIIAKIKEDRRREASNYLLQGEEKAAKIRAEGDLEAKKIRAAAEADRIRLEGLAEAEATRILNDAHRQAPELYEFTRLLRSYPAMFGDEKTQLILSLDHPLLRLFREIPRLSDPEPVSNRAKGAAK